MSQWDEVEKALKRELRSLSPEQRDSVFAFFAALLVTFEPASYDYGVLDSFDKDLEQFWVSKAYGGKNWIQSVGKPVSKNLSLLYSLDDKSFSVLLPAFLLTAMCHPDTLEAVVWQLVPGTTEFYGRIERLTADQYQVVRKWLQLMYVKEDEELPELHHERLVYYWNLG